MGEYTHTHTHTHTSNFYKREEGITLVTLVVTIIVMLIIAGISLNLAVENNGAVKKTKEAVEEYQIEQVKKDREVALSKAVFAKPGAIIKTLKNSSGKEVGKIIADGNEDIFVLPDGFYYVGGCVESGVVISDNSADEHKDLGNDDVTAELEGNQWVWVPVWDASIMYEESDEPIELCGGTGVTTKRYSKSEIISGQTRTVPGDTNGYREPDIVTSGTNHDAEYYLDAGYNSLTEMAQGLVDEYNNMINSVEMFGGFYIGRFEINGTVDNLQLIKNQTSLGNITWYNFYKANKKFSSQTGISSMIYGCQWDVMCNWLFEGGVNINDSGKYGNYKDIDVKNDNGTTIIKAANVQNLLKTGITEYTKTNNIYDLAGNRHEWTMEANSSDYRIRRGGSYSNPSTQYLIFNRGGSIFSENSVGSYSTRPTLIINPK